MVLLKMNLNKHLMDGNINIFLSCCFSSSPLPFLIIEVFTLSNVKNHENPISV
jgi:hypothetical protein